MAELATPTAARVYTLADSDGCQPANGCQPDGCQPDSRQPGQRTDDERRARRAWQLEMVKGMEFYQLAQTLKDISHLEGYPLPALPPTPDPLDVTISKRQWEKQLAEWKKALRAGFAPFYVG